MLVYYPLKGTLVKKFNNIKLGKIVLDRDINKKFLDFKNNQDLFCDGEEYEYYAALYEYIKRLIYNSRNAGEMILNKTFVENLIRIIKSDVLVQNNLKELVYLELIHYLIVYYDTINIIKLNSSWPYTETDKNVKKEATNLLDKQIKDIENFLEEIKYNEMVSRLLEKFKDKISYKKELTTDEFDDLDLIFSTAHNIPQEYIDLYFRNILKYSKKPSIDSLKNALSSFISNYASSHGTYCFLDICKLRFGTLGSYDNHVINISSRMFNNFYLNQLVKKRNLFDTIFHELTHLLQEEIYKKDTLPYEYIIMLEDYLLSNILPTKYTDDNYLCLYNEIDARRLGALNTDGYLRTLGIIPKENTLKSIENDERKHKKDIRYYKRKEKSVDVIFNENIKEIIKILKEEFMIDIFKSYPIFSYLYHEDGTRKTTLELLKEKASTNDEKVIYQINEILKYRKLSKEEISKDLEELILDNNENLNSEKDKLIYELNSLLTSKERSKLLVRLDAISIKMKEFVRGLAILYGEMNELKIEFDDMLVDNVLKRELKEENSNRD